MTRMSVAFALMVSLTAAAALCGADAPAKKLKPVPDHVVPLTPLPGFEKVTGSVRYRNRTGDRQFEVELDHVPLPSGTMLTVEVNGNRIGTMKVGLLHGANFIRRSDRDESLPFITIGTNVVVRTEQRRPVAKARL